MRHEFCMPDAGEGLTEAEVVDWKVVVGDEVGVNQVLVEVETAKALVELPSPFAGRVVELLAAPGEVVPVGQPIIRIDDGHDEDLPSTSGDRRDRAEPGTLPGDPPSDGVGAPAGSDQADGEPTAVLVGYGVRAARSPVRRPRRTPHGADHVEPGPPGETARPVRHGGLELGRAVENRLGGGPVRAKPPVRRLARDLDLDLSDVVPTGPNATITHDDVQQAAAARAGTVRPGRAAGPGTAQGSTPPTPAHGSGQVVARTHVARAMARAMTESVATAVHVTEWVEVEVSAMTRLIRASRAQDAFAATPLTPLTFAALGLVRAARKHPAVNSSLDGSGQNLLLHDGVHLGIAVDSPRGLIVPHICDAQDLDLRGMADALGRLVQTARAGRARPEDLRGSTLTITNIGVFGVDGGTPILNPGEVAILALGRVAARPWVVDGRVEVRDVVTLALSFDHRVVDGALGSRVLREVADFMADPAAALALG